MVDVVLNDHGIKQGSPDPYLPQDVLDTVIDILGNEWLSCSQDEDARDALCKCMLVSRAFFVRARKHIFERLYRSYERREPVTARDVEFFGASPGSPSPNGLGVLPPKAFLREVNIVFDNSKSHEKRIRKRLAHLYTLLTMEGVVSTQLKTFFFQAVGQYHLRAALLEFIPAICSSTSTTMLRFSHIDDFPMAALSHCTNLRWLSLIDVWPKTREDLTNTDLVVTWNEEGFCNLTSLQIDSSEFCMAVLPQAAFKNEKAFTRIEEVDFVVNGGVSGEPILQEFEIIRRARNTLEHLSIDVIHFGADETDEDLAESGTFDLSCFPRLTLLEFKCSLKTHEPFTKRFSSLFTGLHSPSTIHTMNLTIFFEGPPYDADKDHPIPLTADWAALDDILVNRSVFPRLTFLDFRFMILVIYRPLEGMDYRRLAVHQSRMHTLAAMKRFAKSVFPKVARCPLIKDQRAYEVR